MIHLNKKIKYGKDEIAIDNDKFKPINLFKNNEIINGKEILIKFIIKLKPFLVISSNFSWSKLISIFSLSFFINFMSALIEDKYFLKSLVNFR